MSRHLVIVWLALLLGCPRDDAATTPAPDTATASAAPTAPSAAAAEVSCRSDLDCDVCWSRSGCDCVIEGSPRCGPVEDECAAEPCRDRSASCSQGRCVLRKARAGPCSADESCEIYEDDCRCDVFAALKSSPPAPDCEGQRCGTRPAKHAFFARCDTTAERCVLERGPAPVPSASASRASRPPGSASAKVATSAPPPPPRAECRSTADCHTCSAAQCSCMASSTKCIPPKERCVADPCSGKAADCVAGRCQLVAR